MKLYSLLQGFLHLVHCRRLSPLSTRLPSLRPESLFERRENETSSWNPSLALQRLCFDLRPSDRKDTTPLQGHRPLRCGRDRTRLEKKFRPLRLGITVRTAIRVKAA